MTDELSHKKVVNSLVLGEMQINEVPENA